MSYTPKTTSAFYYSRCMVVNAFSLNGSFPLQIPSVS